MANDERMLVWPDTHFPYHDTRKVTVMMKILKDWKPDRLVFLGDLDDMKAPSRFAMGTPDEWKDRVSVTTESHTKKFLNEVRELLPDSVIHYFEGNHEVRLPKYIEKKAKALDGLVTLPKILDLDNLGIQWHPYEEPAVHIAGSGDSKFYAHHGVKISGYSARSAQSELESYMLNGFTGHTHRLGGFHLTTPGTGDLSWYECGHLSDTSQMTYTQVKNWQHGFGFAHISAGKVFANYSKFNGNVVYLDGVKYK